MYTDTYKKYYVPSLLQKSYIYIYTKNGLLTEKGNYWRKLKNQTNLQIWKRKSDFYIDFCFYFKLINNSSKLDNSLLFYIKKHLKLACKASGKDFEKDFDDDRTFTICRAFSVLWNFFVFMEFSFDQGCFT